jgi:hypothetical protein
MLNHIVDEHKSAKLKTESSKGLQPELLDSLKVSIVAAASVAFTTRTLGWGADSPPLRAG